MAKYIIDILNTQHDVVQSWGIDPRSVKTIKDGLQFHIEGSKFTGTVTITYMIGLDLFKVETVSDTDRKDVIVHERVYIDHLVRIIDESEEMTTDYEERVKSQFPVIIIDSDQSDKKKQACSKKLVRISEYTEKACSKKAKDKMNTENKQTAVIYARVSSIGDRQNTERQVSDLSALAIQKGLSIEKVYEEHVSGAKKNIDRPVLTECLDFCKSQHISILLVSELSRLGRNTFEVLSTVKDLMDCGINVYFQKEQMYLLDQNGKSGMFTPILIATLGTCAEMEREDIRFRLNSGLANYKAKGGRVGRRTGSVKTEEVKKDEYREVIALLKRGYSVRNTAKLTGKGISTVQRIKKEFVD